MIQRTWTPRDRRILLVGGCAIALMCGGRFGVPAATEWLIVRRTDAIAALQRSAGAEDERHLFAPMRDSLAARRVRLATFDSARITAHSVPEAGALLASRLADLADDGFVRIVSMQVRPDSVSASAVTRVAVRATGVADVGGLIDMLREVEGRAALMMVRELSVTQADPSQSDAKAESLRFEVLVEGLAVITPAKPVSATSGGAQ